MIAEPLNAVLYVKWFEHIEAEETKDAFCYLIGQAASLGSYNCYPQQKGAVRDFRFYDAQGELPFAFIPNKSWLLFYFRKPAIRCGRYSFSAIQATFDSANENNSAEWTIKLRSISDVQRLWRMLKLS